MQRDKMIYYFLVTRISTCSNIDCFSFILLCISCTKLYALAKILKPGYKNKGRNEGRKVEELKKLAEVET